MRSSPHLLATALAVAPACRQEPDPTPPLPASEQQPAEEPTTRARTPALAPHEYRVEVRAASERGGGPGWISSQSVDDLSGAVVALADPSADPQRVAWAALSNDAGRIPEPLRAHLGRLASVSPEQRTTEVAKTMTDHEELFEALCGDVQGIFKRAASVPIDERQSHIGRQCDLARFEFMPSDATARGYPVLVHGLLLHLQSLGGPHPVEEALLAHALELPPGQKSSVIGIDGPDVPADVLSECETVFVTRAHSDAGPITMSHHKCGATVAVAAALRGAQPLLSGAADTYAADYTNGLGDSLGLGNPKPIQLKIGSGTHPAVELEGTHSLRPLRAAVVSLPEDDAVFVLACVGPTDEYTDTCGPRFNELLERGRQLR